MDAAIGAAGWLLGSAFAVVQWRIRAVCREAAVRAGHELRGPLTAARLGVQLGARTGEISSARLRAIDVELGRATAALEDLDVLKGHARPERARTEVDICRLLEESAEAAWASALAHGTRIECKWLGRSAAAWGVRDRLGQAIGNLIANAIEHGSGVVRVRGQLDDSMIRIEVADEGPGLPLPVAELARRARRGNGSHGRGLAISATVAADHGGRLAAAPSIRGARLVLELPAVGESGRRSGAFARPPRWI